MINIPNIKFKSAFKINKCVHAFVWFDSSTITSKSPKKNHYIKINKTIWNLNLLIQRARMYFPKKKRYPNLRLMHLSLINLNIHLLIREFKRFMYNILGEDLNPIYNILISNAHSCTIYWLRFMYIHLWTYLSWRIKALVILLPEKGIPFVVIWIRIFRESFSNHLLVHSCLTTLLSVSLILFTFF